ncbi:MAG: DUF2007 domain-containing protein [Candidatus Poribacteria bacterium]|nr:DUF2007 domain-containing protein [Candidatus Poribacteria bacterium]
MSCYTLFAIRSYISNFDAEVALSALEAAGIPAMIKKDDCGGYRPHLWLSGVELLVRSEDAESAEAILGSVLHVGDDADHLEV